MITLMYHSITSKASPTPPHREAGAELYDLSVENFRSHLECIKASSPATVITFDDGEMNNYQAAFPVLKEFGFKAYFFVIVNRIGQKEYMGWGELSELLKAGMKIGSHGLTHKILTQLKDSDIGEELKNSKEILEKNLDVPILDFSVPRGFCNDKIIQMAYAAGYKNIFISDPSKRLESVCTPRVAVKGNWNLKRLQQALNGQVPTVELIGDALKNTAKMLLGESGYNWLRKILIYLLK